MDFSKKTIAGADERTKLLKNYGLPINEWPKIKGAFQDDIIDAAACLVTAMRIIAGQAKSFPTQPALDSLNIPIAIWV